MVIEALAVEAFVAGFLAGATDAIPNPLNQERPRNTKAEQALPAINASHIKLLIAFYLPEVV